MSNIWSISATTQATDKEIDWMTGCTIIRKQDTSSVLWGDDKSGFASDRLYHISAELSVLIATVPPGKSFTASNDFRANYDSDEALFILGGEYTIQDPETGEVRVARKDEMIMLKGPQWHFGHNFSSDALRVFEAIAPLDMANSMSETPHPNPEMGMHSEMLVDFPAKTAEKGRRTHIVSAQNCAHILHGRKNPVRMDVYASSPRVSLLKIELAPGQRSEPIVFSAEATVFSVAGETHHRVPEEGDWITLTAEDLIVYSSGTEFEMFNFSGESTSCLIAIGGNLAQAMSPPLAEQAD